MQFVESMWLKRLILCLCPKLNFLFRKQFSEKILPWLVEKISQQCVLLALADCFSITNFDLYMSKGAYDVFALVINFLSSD